MKKERKFERRFLLQAALAAGASAVLTRKATGQRSVPPTANPVDRLDQGPFGTEQDEGWLTVSTTTPSQQHVKNYGLGLVGYTWEENGPALSVRKNKQTLEQAVERMAALPFVDVLYIRCDWRDVQSTRGKLDLHPVWGLTIDAARRHGLRFAFRVQLSNPEFQPEEIALPHFLRNEIPLVTIGQLPRHGKQVHFVEPRYDDPHFEKAFRELNELLAARFDGNPDLEWMDLMQYGFWGEGHTSNLPNPFSDYVTAEHTFRKLTEWQLQTWKHTPLAVNTQPDISRVGNRVILDLAMRAGCWLRSDSIIVEEPEQIDVLGNRPPWLPVIMEDGSLREYDIAKIPVDSAGVNLRENAMLHTLDLGANYWALWTEAENLAQYNDRYPEGFRGLQRRMGYRLRPAWIWQRKRYNRFEVILALANEGVAALPGVLRLTLETADGKFRQSGTLDGGQPLPGKIRQAAFLLPPDVTGGACKVRAELETKGGIRRHVQWACAQALEGDGAFGFTLAHAQDKRWRKGV